ncbi:MAG: SpoIIIAH-like family protein [Lachnospiraceae bacterium]|nr:SpoIIIAH-like family protein [Lachnospiraceae bacterium]
MITALAVMIAIAGYLNFAGNKISEESLVVSDEVMTEEEMTALLDLSQEDIVSDIESLDEEAVLTENYTDEEFVVVTDEGENTEELAYSEIDVDLSANEEEAQEDIIEGTPGEAVFTSTRAVSTLSAAKLLKEQTRAKNKEALEEIVNNEILDSAQKEEAVANMVALTDRSEKEMEAEILLSAKGFTETVVSIGENSVDVVVCMETLTDAQLAQIMDIVTRKTQIPAENVIISPVTQK